MILEVVLHPTPYQALGIGLCIGKPHVDLWRVFFLFFEIFLPEFDLFLARQNSALEGYSRHDIADIVPTILEMVTDKLNKQT